MVINRPITEAVGVKFRQFNVLLGQGKPRIDAIRRIYVIVQTYYRWEKKYFVMGKEKLENGSVCIVRIHI
jgi:putative transposase